MKSIILSESEIPDEDGRRICTSKLLQKLREQGHKVILHSANSFHEFNEDIKDIIHSGIPYAPKSSETLGCPNEFYKSVILAPVWVRKD